MIPTRANMHPDPRPLLCREPPQNLVVQFDKAAQQAARRVQLQAQPALGKVNLHHSRACLQRPANIRLSLIHQVCYKLLAAIPCNPRRRVQQAQRRSRNHRLFDRLLCIGTRCLHIALYMHPISKRPRSQARQLPGMPVCEWNHHPIRRQIGQPGKRISREARLGLFAIGKNRRPRLLQPRNRVVKRLGISALQRRRTYRARLKSSHSRQQRRWPGNASNRFRQYRHAAESIAPNSPSHPPKDRPHLDPGSRRETVLYIPPLPLPH